MFSYHFQEAKVHRLEEIERAYHEKEIELENMKQVLSHYFFYFVPLICKIHNLDTDVK